MKIQIVAVGKLKERFWVQACEEYVKRLRAYVKLSFIEVADRDPARFAHEAQACEKEGEDICACLTKSSYTIVLDIHGTQYSSEAFAAHLDELKLSGVGDVSFVIGGSCGVSEQVKALSNERISFGKITLPHNLARVVLLEQIYRACKISRNEPYHK